MNNSSGIPTVSFNHPEILNRLYAEGGVTLESLGLPEEIYPNSYFVLQCGQPGSQQASALVRVSPDCQSLLLVREDYRIAVKPRNKEQQFLLSTLMDPRVQVQVVAGKAGTGKTLLALAAAMAQIESGGYEKIILTKPMSQVGGRDLGTLPGTLEEKFAPFLLNYASNIEQLLKVPKTHKTGAKHQQHQHQETMNGLKGPMLDFFQWYRAEMVPLQLLRGASFQNAFIIADEVQVLDHHEMLTLGTRVASGSKLILMGDLAQRDEGISREKTGLHRLLRDPHMLGSSLTASIELLKVERGPVAELFTRVFDDCGAQ
jgi:PhoH-like ATPase